MSTKTTSGGCVTSMSYNQHSGQSKKARIYDEAPLKKIYFTRSGGKRGLRRLGCLEEKLTKRGMRSAIYLKTERAGDKWLVDYEPATAIIIYCSVMKLYL